MKTKTLEFPELSKAAYSELVELVDDGPLADDPTYREALLEGRKSELKIDQEIRRERDVRNDPDNDHTSFDEWREQEGDEKIAEQLALVEYKAALEIARDDRGFN